MKTAISLIFLIFFSYYLSYSQDKSKINEKDIDEFNLVSLCHCVEYLKIRSYDFVYFKSESRKLKYLAKEENIVFSEFITDRLFEQNYQAKYDNSIIFKKGISTYFNSGMNFTRLDSLYFEPLVQHYVKEQSKTEVFPYLGFDGVSYFLDCYHRVKEIPLLEELVLFKKLNNIY